MNTLMRKRRARLGGALAVLTLGVATTGAFSYDRYNDGCQTCHGWFLGPASPAGTIFPNNDKHRMHRSESWMATDCNLCHAFGDDNDPFIGFSDGTDATPGLGCVGCHGRDYGGALGVSGVGLRARHAESGVTLCGTCHGGDPLPQPENILPPYYGSPDTLVGDPCNQGPGFGEHWSLGDPRGLDNDGDGLYDGDDPDCDAVSCVEDLDRDGSVGFTDLLFVLSNWGDCPPAEPCPADIDGSGDVAFTDLLAVLAAWGPC